LLTIPVGTGYYMNETQSGSYQTWYIVGGFPQGAGFDSCPFGPTPTPTATITQTPTPTATITQTPTNTQTPTPTCPTCVEIEATTILGPGGQAGPWSYVYVRCDGTTITGTGVSAGTYTFCVDVGTGCTPAFFVTNGDWILVNNGPCTFP
jgi:hypothetical protein